MLQGGARCLAQLHPPHRPFCPQGYRQATGALCFSVGPGQEGGPLTEEQSKVTALPQRSGFLNSSVELQPGPCLGASLSKGAQPQDTPTPRPPKEPVAVFQDLHDLPGRVGTFLPVLSSCPLQPHLPCVSSPEGEEVGPPGPRVLHEAPHSAPVPSPCSGVGKQTATVRERSDGAGLLPFTPRKPHSALLPLQVSFLALTPGLAFTPPSRPGTRQGEAPTRVTGLRPA